jgi:putative two-component system response regulator
MFTKKEIIKLMQNLKLVCDVVRLVHVEDSRQYIVDEDGQLMEKPCACYAIWDRTEPCSVCISNRAIQEKGRFTKCDFIGKELYYVCATYMEVDGTAYSLEVGFKITDATILEGEMRMDVLKLIAEHDKKVYRDSLTGAYNRRYYDEQLADVIIHHGLAMIDVDNFKQINDTYGHTAGDLVLKTIARRVMGMIRRSDAMVRYGGDEFVIVFRDVPEDIFYQKLHQIREMIAQLIWEEYPQVKATVSVGGYYGSGRVKELFQKADVLMYQAKESKDRVEVG